jgi:ribosomal protein S18 acetylase RimI-like enzyme
LIIAPIPSSQGLAIQGKILNEMTLVQNDFTVREGSIKDKEQLKQLGIVSYSQYSNILTAENWAKLNDLLHDEDKLSHLLNISKCYVCLDQQEIVGMAYIIPSGNPWDIFKTEWSYIRMVGVNPKYEGKGIAKALIKLCIEHAKKNNEKTIALHTSEFMNAARHLYESLGFKRVKEIEPRLGKKYWLYMLDI